MIVNTYDLSSKKDNRIKNSSVKNIVINNTSDKSGAMYRLLKKNKVKSRLFNTQQSQQTYSKQLNKSKSKQNFKQGKIQSFSSVLNKFTTQVKKVIKQQHRQFKLRNKERLQQILSPCKSKKKKKQESTNKSHKKLSLSIRKIHSFNMLQDEIMKKKQANFRSVINFIGISKSRSKTPQLSDNQKLDAQDTSIDKKCATLQLFTNDGYVRYLNQCLQCGKYKFSPEKLTDCKNSSKKKYLKYKNYAQYLKQHLRTQLLLEQQQYQYQEEQEQLQLQQGNENCKIYGTNVKNQPQKTIKQSKTNKKHKKNLHKNTQESKRQHNQNQHIQQQNHSKTTYQQKQFIPLGRLRKSGRHHTEQQCISSQNLYHHISSNRCECGSRHKNQLVQNLHKYKINQKFQKEQIDINSTPNASPDKIDIIHIDSLQKPITRPNIINMNYKYESVPQFYDNAQCINITKLINNSLHSNIYTIKHIGLQNKYLANLVIKEKEKEVARHEDKNRSMSLCIENEYVKKKILQRQFKQLKSMNVFKNKLQQRSKMSNSKYMNTMNMIHNFKTTNTTNFDKNNRNTEMNSTQNTPMMTLTNKQKKQPLKQKLEMKIMKNSSLNQKQKIQKTDNINQNLISMINYDISNLDFDISSSIHDNAAVIAQKPAFGEQYQHTTNTINRLSNSFNIRKNKNPFSSSNVKLSEDLGPWFKS